jgi:serine/threonine protein kinase
MSSINANNKKIVNNYQNNKLLDNIIIKFFPDIKKKSILSELYNSITKKFTTKKSPKIKSIIINYEEIKLIPYINSNINTNKIKIYNPIGHGAFGKVYATSNNEILLKIIIEGNSKDDNKDREFKSLIFHYLLYKYYEKTENIKYLCKLNEFGVIEKNKWYAFMENCGLDFIDKFKNDSPDFDTLLKIFYECCKALKIIHDLEYLHLDIKVENFLIKDNQIKIIDFGMVKKNKFITDIPFGTMDYISNDWLKNSYEKNNTTLEYHHDIFSLGCMFIILLYAFIIKIKILMVCPLIIPNFIMPKIKKSMMYNLRKEYNSEQFNSMCKIIKNNLNSGINKESNEGKIRNINNIFSINLIKMMVHPDPKERCNDINKIIEYLDYIFINNTRIHNNNIKKSNKNN